MHLQQILLFFNVEHRRVAGLMREIFKYIFIGLAVAAPVFILCRDGLLMSCGMGICVLAPALFYPAFYGNKWDYLRMTGSMLAAAVVAAGAMLLVDQINDISGMEGMAMMFLQVEILLFSILLVWVTGAFCCKLKKLLKTVIPGIVFTVYLLVGCVVTLTTSYHVPNFYFLLFGIIPLLLILPLNIIMTVRIFLV